MRDMSLTGEKVVSACEVGVRGLRSVVKRGYRELAGGSAHPVP